jgi:hypothetical protein
MRRLPMFKIMTAAITPRHTAGILLTPFFLAPLNACAAPPYHPAAEPIALTASAIRKTEPFEAPGSATIRSKLPPGATASSRQATQTAVVLRPQPKSQAIEPEAPYPLVTATLAPGENHFPLPPSSTGRALFTFDSARWQVISGPALRPA